GERGELTRRIGEAVEQNDGARSPLAMREEHRLSTRCRDRRIRVHPVPRATDGFVVAGGRMGVRSYVARVRRDDRGDTESEHRTTPNRGEAREEHAFSERSNVEQRGTRSGQRTSAATSEAILRTSP